MEGRDWVSGVDVDREVIVLCGVEKREDIVTTLQRYDTKKDCL